MYVIKMNNDKSLTTTVHSTIYKGEKNVDTLIFLLPEKYDDKNIADCQVFVEYVLPNGTTVKETLTQDLEMYKNYYRYTLAVDSDFTAYAGEIYLHIFCVDTYDGFLLKSDEIYIQVTDSGNISSEEDNAVVEVETSELEFIEF